MLAARGETHAEAAEWLPSAKTLRGWRGVFDWNGTEQDLIYLASEVFGENSINLSVRKNGADETHLLAHEMGHNFGRTHPEGNYTMPGLMNNEQEKIKPTVRDNLQFIQSNARNIRKKP